MLRDSSRSKHVCPHCSRTYAASSNLARHLRNHDATKQHTCPICNQSFKRADLLKRDQRLHRGNVSAHYIRRRNVACENCHRCKVRCSGQSPCNSCLKQRRECRFDDRSRRTSLPLDQPAPSHATVVSDSRIERVFESSPTLQENANSPRKPLNTRDLSWSWQKLFEEQSLPLLESCKGKKLDELWHASSSSSVDANNVRPLSLPSSMDTAMFPVFYTSSSEQQIVVTKLVEYARDQIAGKQHALLEPSAFYPKISLEITQTFSIAIPDFSSAAHLLDHFDYLYFTSSNVPYAIIGLDSTATNLHPFFYLSTCALGAMYLNHSSQRFSSMLHERLRQTLLMTPLALASKDSEVCLMQCLYIHTVSALYFGQRQAFTFAQELLTKMVLAARRLKLLSRNDLDEGARRLALGIYRISSLVGVLLDEKPLVSWEELGVPLSSSSLKGIFRDLMNMLLDEKSTMPPISANELELLAFALHEIVWKHAADRAIDSDLTSDEEVLERYTAFSPSKHPIMRALDRLQHQASLITCKGRKQRAQLLTAQLAIHLTHLRLLAPLSLLHTLPYSLVGPQPKRSEAVLRGVMSWVGSAAAKEAVGHVVGIYTLIGQYVADGKKRYEGDGGLMSDETGLWAGMALHNAAVVVWVLAGFTRQLTQDDGKERGGLGKKILGIYAENSTNLLGTYMELGNRVTLQGSLGRALMGEIRRMVEHEFPG